MASNRIDLNVEARTPGKHLNRRSRMARKVPAVIYGSVKPKSILIEEGVVVKYNVRAYENALFNLKSSDPELANVVALMKDIQIHPLTRRPRHVDLFALDLKKAVRVFVEIKTEGKPIGIADGGLLNVVNRQIEIECLPTDIPDAFVIDVSNLGIGDSIHLSEVKIPANVKLISSPDMTLAVVNMAEEEVLTPTAAAVDPLAPAAAAGAPGAAPAGGAPAAGAAAPAAGKDGKPAAAAPAGKDAKAPAPKK